MESNAKQKLFEAYLTPVVDVAYGVALYLSGDRQAADELLLDATTRAYARFDAFRPGTSFTVWFLGILTKRFLGPGGDAGPGDRGATLETAADSRGPWQEAPALSAASFRALDEERIAAAFALLPVALRAPCVLYFMLDCSYQEIADMVDCPLPTLRNRLHRGRQALRFLLSEMAGDGRGRDERARAVVVR